MKPKRGLPITEWTHITFLRLKEFFEDIWNILDGLTQEIIVGDSTNNTTITDEGVRLNGDATVWDDLKFPATAVNPPGQASDPDYDTTYAGWLFNATKTETLKVVAQMPHKWKEGSTIHPHLHWTKTTSAVGNVMWEISYYISPKGGTFVGPTADTESSVIATFPDNDTANEHLITEFSGIDMSSYGLSDMIIITLSRLGGDAADTYGADARLMEFDIHFEIDSMGSNEEYTKL